MDFRLLPMRVLGALAVVVAALAFSPSSAKAHAGHSHAHAQPVQQAAAPEAGHVKAPEFVSTAETPSNTAHELTCTERGCCSNGPCTACHGFVNATVPVTMPPLMSTLLTARDMLPRGSPDIGRLRRPPKSFA